MPLERELSEYAFLTAILNHQEFTLRSLKNYGQVEPVLLVALLRKYRRCLYSVGKNELESGRMLFKVRASARVELRAFARQLWERTRASEAARADGTKKLAKLESLGIAEGYARAAERAVTSEETELLSEKATIWLNGAIRRVNAWKQVGVDAPDMVINRIKVTEGIITRIRAKEPRIVNPELISTGDWLLGLRALNDRLFKWVDDLPLFQGNCPDEALTWMRIVFESPAKDRWLDNVFDGNFYPFEVPKHELPVTRLLVALCAYSQDVWRPQLGEYVSARVLASRTSPSLASLAELACVALLTNARDVPMRLGALLLSVDLSQLSDQERKDYRLSLTAFAMWVSPPYCAQVDALAKRVSDDCRILARRKDLRRLAPPLVAAAARGNLSGWSAVATELLGNASTLKTTVQQSGELFARALCEPRAFQYFAQDPGFLFSEPGRVLLAILEAERAAKIIETDNGFMLMQPESGLLHGPLPQQYAEANNRISRYAHERTARTTRADVWAELAPIYGIG